MTAAQLLEAIKLLSKAEQLALLQELHQLVYSPTYGLPPIEP